MFLYGQLLSSFPGVHFVQLLLEELDLMLGVLSAGAVWLWLLRALHLSTESGRQLIAAEYIRQSRGLQRTEEKYYVDTNSDPTIVVHIR